MTLGKGCVCGLGLYRELKGFGASRNAIFGMFSVLVAFGFVLYVVLYF